MKNKTNYSDNKRTYRDFYTDDNNMINPTLIKTIKRKRKSNLDKIKNLFKKIIGK